MEELEDGLVVQGARGLRGGRGESHGDHRMAMALAVAGLVAGEGVAIHGAEVADVSYPLFWDHLGLLSGGSD